MNRERKNLLTNSSQFVVLVGVKPFASVLKPLEHQYFTPPPPQHTHTHTTQLQDLSNGERANYEQNVQDAVSVFPKLQTGLDVNVKFNR